MNEVILNYLYGFSHINNFFDFFIIFLAEWYGLLILGTLFIYLFSHKDNLKKGVTDLVVVSVTAVSSWFIAHFFKDVFHTLRPFDAMSPVLPLVAEDGYAFPSGHATFFMALASSLWFYHKRLAIFFGISAIIIGLARVSAGVHWPVDIIGGLILGLVLGVTLYKLINLAMTKLDK